MADTTDLIDSTGGDNIVDSAISAGVAIAAPHKIDDRFYSVVTPRGAKVHTIDLEELDEKFRDVPRRKTGTVHVHTAASFVEYLAKHGLVQSEVWADQARSALVGVINAHEASDNDVTMLKSGADDDAREIPYQSANDAGWSDHRVALELVHTKAWKVWVERDNKMMSQTEFAELIEARAIDIVEPSAAEMLELAESFQATRNVEFQSVKILQSGERQLEYKETTASKAGQRGDMEIPKAFVLSIVPFEGADPYSILARFRYRINDGRLTLGYVLERPEDVLAQAFADIVQEVENEVTQPVFRGRPA